MENLKYFDIFGQKYTFTIFKKDKYRTYIGFALTLFMIFVGIAITILFGSDLFYRIHPIINYQNVRGQHYFRTPLNNTNFLIPWTLYDQDLKFVNSSGIVYPLVQYRSYVKDSNGEYQAKKQINLNYSFCGDKYNNLINGISTYYCIDFESQNLTIGGFFDGDFVDYFFIQLLFCKNSSGYWSPDDNCTSFDTLNEFFNKGVYISFYYPSVYFDGNDVNRPMTITYKNYYYQIALGLQKMDRLFMQNSILNDDQGVIFSTNKTTQYYSGSQVASDYKFFRTDMPLTTNTTSILYGSYFYLIKNYDKYTRSYMKFQNLAALVGGVLNLIKILCSFFNRHFCETSRDSELMSEFFEFDEKNEKKFNFKNNKTLFAYLKRENVATIKPQNVMSKKNRTDRNSNLKNQSNLLVLNTETSVKKSIGSEIKENLKKLIENYIKTKKAHSKIPSIFLQLKWKYFCGRWFSKKQSQILNAYDTGLNYLKSRLDIVNYLKMLEIFDKVRVILLNDSQNISMDFMQKHNLFDENNLEFVKILTDSDLKKDLKIVIDYFSSMNQMEPSSIDHKIYDCLDIEIKKIITKVRTNEN